MADAEKPPSLEDIDTRLRALRAREQASAGDGPRNGSDIGSGMGLGVRIVVELVAGIAVGCLIGYGLDRWLGTKPWLMVVMLFLGATAGVMNSYRAAKGIDDSVGLGLAAKRRSRRKDATDSE